MEDSSSAPQPLAVEICHSPTHGHIVGFSAPDQAHTPTPRVDIHDEIWTLWMLWCRCAHVLHNYSYIMLLVLLMHAEACGRVPNAFSWAQYATDRPGENNLKT